MAVLDVMFLEPHDKWLKSLLKKLGFLYADEEDIVINGCQVDDEDDTDEEYEDNTSYLKDLDPKEWKNQDHYAVFGLQKKRFKATENDIRKAYRRTVLLHHPDKRMSRSINLDTDYYACITKAYEILGDPVKRRSYDSVDDEFDDEIPPVNANSRTNFYQVFGPVFESNERWSNIKPLPKLGCDTSKKDEVEKFYNFWYSFDSWREFSYLDEEDKERGQDRDERKWIEKQNKAERAKRKKEEMLRIRQLVDAAYHCDPRISRFKDEERKRKENEKKAKQEAKEAKISAERRARLEVEERERKAKEDESEMMKKQRDQERREKEALKKQRRKERKTLEQDFEAYNYFAADEMERVKNLEEFDKLCQLYSVEKLTAFREEIVDNKNDSNMKKEIFMSRVEAMNAKINEEKMASLQLKESTDSSSNDTSSGKAWSHDDTQLLIKAVNLFPAGKLNRWETVAAFINQHTNSKITRKARDVLNKAKELQKLDPSIKNDVNMNAYKVLEAAQNRLTANAEASPSTRYDNAAEMLGLNPTPWTSDEQRLLEQAMKTFAADCVDRWDKIADCLPNRSKKDCIRRYKELVELIRSKKAAQVAVQKNHKK